MRTVLAIGVALFAVNAAQAAIPTMNATCPTGIELHVDAGGYGYINGHEAEVVVFDASTFDVKSENGHITVSVLINPDGTAMVSYTRRNGRNGVCEASVVN